MTTALITGYFGLLAVLVAGLFQLKKVKAEAGNIEANTNNAAIDGMDTAVSAALSMIKPMAKRLEALEALSAKQGDEIAELRAAHDKDHRRIRGLEEHTAVLEHGVTILTDQIINLDALPLWRSNWPTRASGDDNDA